MSLFFFFYTLFYQYCEKNVKSEGFGKKDIKGGCLQKGWLNLLHTMRRGDKYLTKKEEIHWIYPLFRKLFILLKKLFIFCKILVSSLLEIEECRLIFNVMVYVKCYPLKFSLACVTGFAKNYRFSPIFQSFPYWGDGGSLPH